MLSVSACILFLCTLPSYAKVRTEKNNYVIEDAEGYAVIKDGKKAAAREEAKRMAYRDAVDKALGACVSGISKSEKYGTIQNKIFSKSSGLVKNFKITDETVSGDVLVIRGSCTVSEKSFDGILGPEIISMLGNPRVMICVDERVGKDAPFISTVETELLRIFEKAGYLIVDPDQAKMLLTLDPQKAFNDPSTLAGAARTLRADIIILARALAGSFANQKIHGINLYGVSGTVQLKAVLPNTAYQISSKTISGSTGKTPAQSVSGGAGRIFRSAVAQAAEEIIYKIAYGMASAGSLGGITVNVKIAGASFKDVENITEVLRQMAGDSGGVFERSYQNGLLEIDVVSPKTARNVASFLSDYTEVDGLTAQTVSAHMMKKQVAAAPQEVKAEDITININIENVKAMRDATDIEDGLRKFIGANGQVSSNYNDAVLNLTVTSAADNSEAKDVQAIAKFLEGMSIRIDSSSKDSIKGWKPGGWLW